MQRDAARAARAVGLAMADEIAGVALHAEAGRQRGGARPGKPAAGHLHPAAPLTAEAAAGPRLAACRRRSDAALTGGIRPAVPRARPRRRSECSRPPRRRSPLGLPSCRRRRAPRLPRPPRRPRSPVAAPPTPPVPPAAEPATPVCPATPPPETPPRPPGPDEPPPAAVRQATLPISQALPRIGGPSSGGHV